MHEHLSQKIQRSVSAGKSVLLVGETDSGKSQFVRDDLMPYLSGHGLEAEYVEKPDDLPEDGAMLGDVVVIDEVEILWDKDFLESLYGTENYYPEDYLKKVAIWEAKLSKIHNPCVYVITRNDESAILNIKQNFHSADWDGRPIEVLVFE